MEEFKKCERDAEVLLCDQWRHWRLASVDEVNNNLAKITESGILNSSDTVRLLDGCLEKSKGLEQYMPNMEHMILVRKQESREQDGSFAPDMYSGVKRTSQGGQAAVLLSCEDKITEAICFVLYSIVQNVKENGKRQEELDKLTESLEDKFHNGRTLLHFAVDQPLNLKQATCIAMLIKEKFPHGKELIKAEDKDGVTALHLAALHGNAELCEFLVKECEMEVAKEDQNGRTALYYANQLSDRQKREVLVDLLLKYFVGNHFKKCKRDAKLLLDAECLNWRLASVDEVNKNLAKIRAMENLKSWDTVRLLDGCVENYKGYKQYRPDMEDMILVKTEIPRSEDGSFDPAVYSGVKLYSQGGEVALSLACEDKITEVICFVLDCIVNNKSKIHPRYINSLKKSLKEKFDNGRKVLHCAVDQPLNKNHPITVAKFLMKIWNGEKQLINAADIYGRTALHFAALRGNDELCKFLIEECKMRADEKDINKENVLHFAMRDETSMVFKYVCGRPEVQNITGSQDAQRKTALHKAAARGSEDMIETLLSCISKSNDKQMYLSQANLLEQAEGLTEEEKIKLVFIRQADLFGQTALLEAARGGHVEAVKLLLEKGSRPLHERNSDGRTALQYAVQLSDEKAAKDMASLLLDKFSSEDEKSLLLWAYAIGSGTAEASAKTPQVRDYLKTAREPTAESSKNLLSSAIEKNHEIMAWELVCRGANTAHLDPEREWTGETQERLNNCMLYFESLPLYMITSISDTLI